jgi:hypothetical protein
MNGDGRGCGNEEENDMAMHRHVCQWLGAVAALWFLIDGRVCGENVADGVPALFTEKDPLYSAATALEHWWPADGHGLDLVGDRNATLMNGASYAPGRVGRAFGFDGRKSVVDLGRPAGAAATPDQAFTLMFWFRAEEQSGWQFLAFCWRDSGLDICINQFQAGQVAAQLGLGPGRGETFGKDWNNTVANFHPIGEWHHLAFAFDGTRASLFRDGRLASETPWTIYKPSDSPLLLGADDRQIGVNSFKGQIQDVALFRRGLTALEIGAIYQAETAPVAMVIGAGDLQKFASALDARPAPLAWYAAQRLASDPAAARVQFPRPVPPDAKTIQSLVRELDSDSYEERERASDKLSSYGAVIAPSLREVLEQKPSSEVANRIQGLLAGWEKGVLTPREVHAARVAAIRVRVQADPLESSHTELPVELKIPQRVTPPVPVAVPEAVEPSVRRP